MFSTAVALGGPKSQVSALEAAPDVDVITPGEPGFDDARLAWNCAVEHRPLAVALPTSVAGVAEVVRFARDRGISVAVQATGHGPTRPADGVILLNLSRLTGVSVNRHARRAIVRGGAKWQPVLDAVTPLGLAPLVGSTPDVSAIGYTLGGGLGWLGRKYGTSADSVHSFELVTPAGDLVHVDAESDPDLFWALRGAGAGHLGVVTAMEIELYPISELYAGNLMYPAALATEVLQRWRDWIPNVPDDLTSAVTMLNYPDIDEVPIEFRGQSFVNVRGAFDGPMAQGERLLAHWREWRTPHVDAFGPLPFSKVAEISEDPLEPVPNAGTGVWLAGLSDATIDELVAVMSPHATPQLVQAELRHYGGAVASEPTVPSAFGNRDAEILLELVGITPTQELVDEVDARIAELSPRIASDLTGGHYLNYVEGETRRHGVEAGIPSGTLQRLASVKTRLDPENLFDHGLSVVGAPEAELSEPLIMTD